MVPLMAAALYVENCSARNFKWFGVSQSGPEVNNQTLPGVAGVDYSYP